jgi:transcriptional antiterminator
MRPELRDRRRETWRLLHVEGISEKEAIAELTDEYGVSEGTISEDIRSVEEWLPEISPSAREAELSLVYELEETRQRLYAMAEEAQKEDDLQTELKIQQSIINTIELGRELEHDNIDRDPPADIEEKMDELTKGGLGT